MNPAELAPAELAKACSEKLHSKDWASQAMGMTVTHTAPGESVVQMQVRKDMLNGHAICHGGMVFTLADTAFAHACNNTNKSTVASGCSINFQAPAYAGDTLTATCTERTRSARTGVYDVEVTNQAGTVIALFRGNSYQIKGELIAGEKP